MNLQPLLTLLDFWADMGKGLDAMMQPIYWAISGIVVGFHWLYSHFLNPDSGLIWLLSIVSLTIVVRVAMIPLFVRQINSSRKTVSYTHLDVYKRQPHSCGSRRG